MQPSQRDNIFLTPPQMCVITFNYAVPQRMDGVKIWHLIEPKYSSVEPHDQQVRGFVHRSTSDTTMFPGKQVPVVEEGQLGERLRNNTKHMVVATTGWLTAVM